eukprot:351936-Rhodomonas_salina.1
MQPTEIAVAQVRSGNHAQKKKKRENKKRGQADLGHAQLEDVHADAERRPESTDKTALEPDTAWRMCRAVAHRRCAGNGHCMENAWGGR